MKATTMVRVNTDLCQACGRSRDHCRPACHLSAIVILFDGRYAAISYFVYRADGAVCRVAISLLIDRDHL